MPGDDGPTIGARHAPPLTRAPNGPLSVHLDGLLRALGVPSRLALREGEDLGEGEWAAGRVVYQQPDGGYVSATVQGHPPGGLRDVVFTYGGRLVVHTWPSGTQFVVKELSEPSGHVQVILRRPDRRVLQITSGGLPGIHVPRPLSRDEIIDLARRADAALGTDGWADAGPGEGPTAD